MSGDVWAVRHREGACASAIGEPEEGAWNVPTECGYFVGGPYGFDLGVEHVTCPECLYAIEARA